MDRKAFKLEWLLKPDFSVMTQEQRLLRVAMLAYQKLHPMCYDNGMSEAEISESLRDEICNTAGDKFFNKWLEDWKR